MEKQQFEETAGQLRGAAIVRIRYFIWADSAPADDREAVRFWQGEQGCEQSAYGLEMMAADGRLFTIIMAADFPGGISIHQLPLQSLEPNTKAVDVSQTSGWSALIERRIIDLEVVSEELSAGNEKAEYVHALRIVVEGQACAEVREGGPGVEIGFSRGVPPLRAGNPR